MHAAAFAALAIILPFQQRADTRISAHSLQQGVLVQWQPGHCIGGAGGSLVLDCGRFCGWYPKGRVRRFSFSHVFVEGSPARVLESTIQCIHETKKSTDTYAFVEGWMVVMLAVRMQDTAHVGGGSFRY
jgi:hypothetical protein